MNIKNIPDISVAKYLRKIADEEPRTLLEMVEQSIILDAAMGYRDTIVHATKSQKRQLPEIISWLRNNGYRVRFNRMDKTYDNGQTFKIRWA